MLDGIVDEVSNNAIDTPGVSVDKEPCLESSLFIFRGRSGIARERHFIIDRIDIGQPDVDTHPVRYRLRALNDSTCEFSNIDVIGFEHCRTCVKARDLE